MAFVEKVGMLAGIIEPPFEKWADVAKERIIWRYALTLPSR
jgi:hypothetical protein